MYFYSDWILRVNIRCYLAHLYLHFELHSSLSSIIDCRLTGSVHFPCSTFVFLYLFFWCQLWCCWYLTVKKPPNQKELEQLFTHDIAVCLWWSSSMQDRDRKFSVLSYKCSASVLLSPLIVQKPRLNIPPCFIEIGSVVISSSGLLTWDYLSIITPLLHYWVCVSKFMFSQV